MFLVQRTDDQVVIIITLPAITGFLVANRLFSCFTSHANYALNATIRK